MKQAICQGMEEMKGEAEFMKVRAIWKFFQAEAGGDALHLFAPGGWEPLQTLGFKRLRVGDFVCHGDYVLAPRDGERDRLSIPMLRFYTAPSHFTANGTFDTTLDANGLPSNGDYGNTFMKLSTNGNSLDIVDYFTMYNTVSESNEDLDLGFGGALVLPDLQDGLGTTWHLAVGAGKDAIIYVVNRDSMGKFNPNNDNAIYQEVLSNGLGSGGCFGHARIFEHLIECQIRSFVIADNRLTENLVRITGYWPSSSMHSQYSNLISVVKLRTSRWARST